MSRITKTTASELIRYIKKVEVWANFYDPHSTSAFEFTRQMDSKRLMKINPIYEINMNLHDNSSPPVIRAEYTNGKIWETTNTHDQSVQELRYELFLNARIANDEAMASGDSTNIDDGDDGKGGSKGSKTKASGKK